MRGSRRRVKQFKSYNSSEGELSDEEPTSKPKSKKKQPEKEPKPKTEEITDEELTKRFDTMRLNLVNQLNEMTQQLTNNI